MSIMIWNKINDSVKITFQDIYKLACIIVKCPDQEWEMKPKKQKNSEQIGLACKVNFNLKRSVWAISAIKIYVQLKCIRVIVNGSDELFIGYEMKSALK